MAAVLGSVEWVLLATTLLCVSALGLILWEGGRWDRVVSVGNPVPRLVIGALAFAGWHLMRAARRGGRRRWPVALGQLALLGTGLAAGLLLAEHALRAWLRIQQGRGSMEDLAAHERGDAALRPNSRHPLVAIVRLSPNGLLAYELRPNLKMNFGVCRLRTNGAGMRDSLEYAAAREPGTVRILGLGDSGMFGWGVHQDRDYLSVIESNLNSRARGVRYEILNAAVPGYNTFQEVEALRYRGLDFRPDTVVLGWCSNDTDLPFFLRRQQTFRKDGLFYLRRLLFDRAAFRRETSPEARRAEDVDADRIDPRVLAGAGIDGVRRAFHELAALARRHGFHALVFGPMDDGIIGLCREANLEYFNTLSIPADRHPGVRIHGIHPDSGGHAVLAGYLEEALESRGWLDPPGTVGR
jgi:lysophospholipase L1-like esterase